MATLIHTKELTIKTQGGDEKTFILSKFPAIQGREIICKYPLTAVPKVGDYAVNEETMLKLMGFVGVQIGENIVPLSTRAMVDTHIGDWETLMRVEWAMLEYNTSFFQNGKLSIFLGDLSKRLPQLITKTLTEWSQQSSAKATRRSKN